MNSVLYIAAKAPLPGFVKTRLGRTIGDPEAAALYAAFLRDLALRFAGAPFPVGWFVTPRDAWHELEPLVGLGRDDARIVPQGTGDWTERQRRLFRTAPLRDEERVVLVASDSPQLELAVVEQAFHELDHNELVLGPTSDGGYYLLGMRGWHDVLDGVRMSTDDVHGEIASCVRAAGLSLALLERTFDVDEADDLEQLAELARTRPDLATTRAALDSLEPLAAAAAG